MSKVTKRGRKIRADGVNKPWTPSVPLGPPLLAPEPPRPPRLCRHGHPSFVDADGVETDRCSGVCGQREGARRKVMPLLMMAAAMGGPAMAPRGGR